MSVKRRTFSPSEKYKVAVEAIKGEMTISELSSKYQVHPTQINSWKKEALNYLSSAFSGTHQKNHNDNERQMDELYKQIGQLKVENDFLKKKCDLVK
jgi:transposase